MHAEKEAPLRVIDYKPVNPDYFQELYGDMMPPETVRELKKRIGNRDKQKVLAKKYARQMFGSLIANADKIPYEDMSRQIQEWQHILGLLELDSEAVSDRFIFHCAVEQKIKGYGTRKKTIL